MRIFGGEKIKNLMTALNVPEDEPIQANMISGAIESAQSKIEGFNFDARHHLLEYDDVINKHREIIYKKRREFLSEVDPVKKYVSLQVVDHFWQEHLSDMDHMRDSVRLRAYGGHDPLVEYKNEGHKMFQMLLQLIDQNIKENLAKTASQPQQFRPQQASRVVELGKKEPGRNAPCPCGSGKKFKKCHGK